MVYTFNKNDSGIVGKAFEMAVKDALRRKNADHVSPVGQTDFRFKKHCYDVKQNGTVIRYDGTSKYIKGSNRVIYATHVSYTVENENKENISISIDLGDTQMFCVDRNEFVNFLLENGCAKQNKSRGTTNIQTCYNYTKNAYHGRKGRIIEEWCYDNEFDPDDIISAILEGLEK